MEQTRYNNYHKHSDYSNLLVPDSVITLNDYVSRIKELNHTILSSCEHGWQGNVWLCETLAKQNDLEWRCVSEAYFVKNRFEQDKTNAHLILAAKTNEGRKQINAVLSEANATGFYYKPRIDLELLSWLNPQDVFITSACVGGVFKYGFEEAERLLLQFASRFKNSFMLEVQYHNTDRQKEVNQFLLNLYRKHGIPLIFGTDSHFIYPSQAELRDVRLKDKQIFYEDEDGWYMDYPDREEAVRRFKAQAVLPNALIEEAINNTLIFDSFENISFSRTPKIPTIYPTLSQEEKNDIYTNFVHQKFEEYTKNMNEQEKAVRKQGMNYEVETIISTGMADYPLLTGKMIERGKELGGIITRTGRGSSPSYFTNMLLGFTSIDRFGVPVTMYPDRFISKERLLSGSLPDIDNNVSNREPFIKAVQELLGEHSIYPMVAYGTLKELSAWKMYCRANEVPFDIANKISDSLKEYSEALKYADDDEKEEIRVDVYIPTEYISYYNNSLSYQGIVDNISPHPCAYLLLNEDIRREIGIMRLKAKDKDGNIVFGACIDGAMADQYGFLKQDLLLVDVVAVNNRAYELAGIPLPTVPELIKLTQNDPKTWSVYAKKQVMGLNQVEKPKTADKVARYNPKNISELSAFVAAVRPSFASMIDVFLARQKFSYNIPTLDKLLQTKEMPYSFILYQEQIMKILQYGGLTPAESYSAIKAIAKKHPEKVLPIKEMFKTTFSKNILSDEKNISAQQAEETTEKVWKIIEDSCSYGFNSSHAISVALDSLYGAYCKAHHPLAYYTALMENLAQKGDKKRLAKVRAEAEQEFSVELTACRFRNDNRTFSLNNETKKISTSLRSVKFMSDSVAQELYALKAFNGSFLDLMVEILENTSINSRQIDILIALGYFEEFGSIPKLVQFMQEFRDGASKYKKTYVQATKQKKLAELATIWNKLPEEKTDLCKLLKDEIEYMTFPISKFQELRGTMSVLEIIPTNSPTLVLYNNQTGTTGTMKIRKQSAKTNPVEVGNILQIKNWEEKPSYSYRDGKMSIIPNQKTLWLLNYQVI